MLDRREELPLGDRGCHRLAVAGVEEAFEDHPPVADVAVAGEVDPAEATVRDASEHLVLPSDEVTGRQLRGKRIRGAALAAKTFGAPGQALATAPDRIAAVAAEPF